jgi:uncharacterized membrane protein HdeD (DUF308 family)
MNALKYLGVLILIAGVVILAVSYFFTSGTISNTVLMFGIILIIAGYLSHIFLNKKIQ